MIENIVSIFVGGIITWFVAFIYYRKAASQLAIEAKRLKQLNEILLVGMENQGWVDLRRDEKGEISGLNIKIVVPGGELKLS